MSDTSRSMDMAQHANSKKKATIIVTATRMPMAPWVNFAMDADYPDGGGKQDRAKLKFDKDAGPFELTFRLKDETKGLRLAFMNRFEDAMWVTASSDCPQGEGNGNGAITCTVPVKADKLVVDNANAIEATLTFALRFDGVSSAPGEGPPYVYDPQIANGGGSINQH